MRRGEFYLVSNSSTRDPKRARPFVVVSRDALIGTKFSSVICAPIYSVHDGLTTQVAVGLDEGLKHDSSIHCDELVSLPKIMLTNYLGMLSSAKIDMLNQALKTALDLA